jgi:hypothetical protein
MLFSSNAALNTPSTINKLKIQIFFILSLLLSGTPVLFGQAPPQKISYQFIIRNNQNQLIQNSQVSLRISILKGSISGTTTYIETHKTETNGNGAATIEVGGGTTVSGDFSLIDWSAGDFFIKTEIDPSGQEDYTISGTSQLLSVPYSLFSGRAAIADSLKGELDEKDPVFINSIAASITADDTTRWNSKQESGHYIGELFGGGVIFHLWKDSLGIEHGLVADLSDLNTNSGWSNITDQEIGPAAKSSWDGLGNSNAIVAQPGHTNSIAAECLNSTNGGKDDWYLPSIDELSLLWHNRYLVNRYGGFVNGKPILPIVEQYWTSTELSSQSVYIFDFIKGSPLIPIDPTKEMRSYQTRAIRTF